MQSTLPFWYVLRTKPKHGRIAAANLKRQRDLDVFLPRLRLGGLMTCRFFRLVNPLFPNCLLVRCKRKNRIAELRRVSGIAKITGFGDKIPHVFEAMIKELQFHFASDDTLVVKNCLMLADEVSVSEDVFPGLNALELKNLPARKPVQILREVLGGSRPIEVRRETLLAGKKSLAAFVPVLVRSLNQERVGVHL